MRCQKWETSISVLVYTNASLPFSSFPYKYPPFFRKIMEKNRKNLRNRQQKVRKIIKQQQNSGKIYLEIQKIILSPVSLSLLETHTKKVSSIFVVIFVGKAIGMGQFLNNFSIYIKSFFYLACSSFLLYFLCSCIYCVYIYLFISMFILLLLLLLVYIVVFVSLDGYWIISQAMYGKYPQGGKSHPTQASRDFTIIAF